MDDTIKNYNILLNIIYQFYMEIKDNISIFFFEKEDKDKLKIDFHTDFVISKDFNGGFIFFDNKTQKFLVSIPQGISKYKKIKNIKPTKLIDVRNKLKSEYFTCFNDEELSQIIEIYNIDFMTYIKSEFLQQYVNKIIYLREKRKLYYSDDYITCSENVWFKINAIIIEMETRLFASKFDLFYIPTSIGNKYILKLIHLVCMKNQAVIFNGNIEDLLENLPYFISNKLIQYETREFEKKYHLKKNSLNYF